MKHTWKIGDNCFVDHHLYRPAKVEKIGRKYVTVRTKNTVYEFDITKDHWPVKGFYYGFTPQLMTVEKAKLNQAREVVREAAQNLKDFSRTCPNTEQLETIGQVINVWLESVKASEKS